MKEIQQVKNKLIIDSSIPVINNPKILNYLCDIQSQSFKHNKKNLSKNLLDELKSSFGNHNKCLRLEFMTKVWILQYDDLTFNVFTAKGKGTSIEICGYSHEEIRLGKKQNEIMEFLERLHEMINITHEKEFNINNI